MQRGHHQNSPSAAGSADLAFAAEPLLVNCQCGSISFRTPTAQYLDLFHCHCTECQKQSATAYGTSAIYTAEGLFPLSRELKSRLRVYTRATDSGGSMDCYFCSTCGSRLFHRIIDEDGMPKETVSIKGGCIKGLDWTGGKHIYTRSAVVEVPKECEQYDTFPDMSRQVEKNK
ncbi:Mss4-like protein [Truncatella angustata]|uniref:Mss4-like protein n=1 Tax=Truncatella angustata TaxID=152316 RepID=A0A9P8UB35_9PEZI|nr:Mss4-like protein [Truncatella angustata]KAH6638602.1 Mss4-like protein [Truncatella angustata]